MKPAAAAAAAAADADGDAESQIYDFLYINTSCFQDGNTTSFVCAQLQ